MLDAELYLSANGLKDIIKSGKIIIVEQEAEIIIFSRHHLNQTLKFEYLIVKNSLTV